MSNRKYKYQVAKYCQFGAVRGTWSKLFGSQQTEFTNRRKAEHAANARNRQHRIDVANAEEIYAVREIE